MPKPSFREATASLCLSGPDLAELFGTSAQHIRQMKLDPTKAGARPAPDGWEAVLAAIAREKGGELARLAEELEG